mgnify:CR=1 FL=1
MGMQPGEMKLTKAAKALGVSLKTMRLWALRAWEGRPVEHGVKYGRRDPSNKLYVSAKEVEERVALYAARLAHVRRAV